jgi:nucleoid-associated protein YgaU
MRRSGIAASLIVLPVLVGCSWFGRDNSSAADNQQPDYYTRDSGSTYDPYATTTSTYEQEPAASSGPRYHTVTKTDTLHSISRKYYGNDKRWRDIYNANSGEISDPNKIKVGQRLVIP